MLRPSGFIRIERSILLNISAVAFLQRSGNGTFVFTLTSDEQLQSTVAFRETILRTFPVVASRR
jgi:DNA-binding LytR/AlgR family response regulator